MALKTINGKNVNVIMYDSDVDKDKVKEYGVRGFPSLFIEKDGNRESFPHRTYDKISEYLKILSDKSMLTNLIQIELNEVLNRLDDTRRTEINDSAVDHDDEDLIQKETDRFIALVDSELKSKESDLLEI